MDPIANAVRRAREAAALSAQQLAEWARLDLAHFNDLEEGRAEFTWRELDRCARVFGLRVDDLLEGEAGRAPMTLLLRSDRDESSLEVQENLTVDSCELLGEFQRALRDIADLERQLCISRPAFPAIRKSTRKAELHPGESLARTVRRELGLGDDAIPSMVELLRALGVYVLWESKTERSLDGACARLPVCGVLVVLDEDFPSPWRTRTTLAHELCHLLFDLRADRPVLLSPSHARGRHLGDLERTAKAFAAHLLVPSSGVKLLVGSKDPTSEDAIGAVGASFGVGRQVVINRLQQVFGFSEEQRDRMGERTAARYRADFTRDEPPERSGLRGEPLFGLVHQALKQGCIPPSRARRILGVSPAEPLPFDDLPPKLRAPTLTPDMRAIRVATTYLFENHPALFAHDAEPLDGKWRVAVYDGRGARGSLLIGTSYAVEQDDTHEPTGRGE
jgi:Zn-dependent peptidase ImmA (M78 family)/transcriptional regulator with XRE-family HTH domain